MSDAITTTATRELENLCPSCLHFRGGIVCAANCLIVYAGEVVKRCGWYQRAVFTCPKCGTPIQLKLDMKGGQE